MVTSVFLEGRLFLPDGDCPTLRSAGVLLDALKANIKGVCIGTQAGILKDIRSSLQTINDTQWGLEREYGSVPSPTTLAKIRDQVSKHANTVEDAVQHLSKHHVARVYAEGGRPGQALSSERRNPRARTQ
ncbi:hypothetical protein NDU88_003260 [Pleurodeles waltl]|uniref:Uncharacterized protein n=1 Tax=Pleurodeles waltl TaxID=8319 RepID=A0AAV7W6D6_PLEWA|nr:hypothetical protein NDU88_003260 [Pleurodeles waltl]